MNICEKCVYEPLCSFSKVNDGIPITHCFKFSERKPTNASRLRSLPDEELAKAIARKITGCYWCPATNELECAECVLEWLRKEADE